jgi:hypothetical protein
VKPFYLSSETVLPIKPILPFKSNLCRYIAVAFINAFAFPLSCIGKVWRWQLVRKIFTPRVKTQRQLNQLYRPPKFLLSERYGPFLAAMVYSIIFAPGMPVLYAVLVLWWGKACTSPMQSTHSARKRLVYR